MRSRRSSTLGPAGDDLIINTKDVKGTDQEANEQKESLANGRQEEHSQQQAEEQTQQQGKKTIPNGREKKMHTKPQGQSSTKGHRAETWRSQARRKSRKSMFRWCRSTGAPIRDMREEQHGARVRVRCIEEFRTCDSFVDVRQRAKQRLEVQGLRVAVRRSLRRLHHGLPWLAAVAELWSAVVDYSSHQVRGGAQFRRCARQQ